MDSAYFTEKLCGCSHDEYKYSQGGRPYNTR